MGLSKARLVVTGAAPMPPYLNEFLKASRRAREPACLCARRASGARPRD
jgi:hypothetical protein